MSIYHRNGTWLFRRPSGRRPLDRVRLAALELENRVVPSVNPIVAENQLPGTPQSVWDVSGAGDSTLQGFSTDISVNQGQTVFFKINDTALAPYHIDIYRMGYYGGLGARKVATIDSAQVQRTVQPAPLTDPTTALVDAGNWSVSASWAVPTTATSGIYFARLTRDDTGGASHIVFVVRNDSSHSDLLFQTSDSTWQAYNTWGGYSLYQNVGTPAGPSPTGGAVAVSYNRPLTVRGVTGGFGSYNSPFHAEYPMVRWLEANGYDVSYFTDVDTDRNGALIKNHKVFLSVGHDEYWSGAQRANVEAARDAGVNLAFFSGNEVFWKTRWQNSIDSSNAPYRTLVSYKESKSNARTDPMDISQGVWTGTWRDARFSPPADGGRPENGLTGTIYMNDRTNTDIGISMNVTAAEGLLPFWRNTAVAQQAAAGQAATVGDRVVGYEVDEDLDNGFRPAGLVDLSSTTFTTTSHVISADGTVVGNGTGNHSMTLYRAPSGALVFGAGTVQWSWGLDGQHDDGVSVPDRSMQQATVNLFADMNVQPGSLQAGLVPATASTDVVPPTSVITAPANGANIQTGSAVTIRGTATDTGGGAVAGVEVSVDGGQTWHPAQGTTSWTYTWVPDTAGQVNIRSRAFDTTGNIETPSAGVTVTISFQPTSRTGLVAEYSFNQGSGTTLTDTSGNGNNGTISNATWTAGLFGQALSFNGTNSWVTVNSSASLNLTTGMTLEAWVKPSALADWSSVILKERTNGLGYALYGVSGANQPPSGYVHVGSADNAAQGVSALPVGAWSHLTATYDGTNLKLYVNGTLVSTQAVTGNIVTSTGALRIGGNSVWGEYFNGLIDQVRIYNRALNQGEIRADMSTPVGGTLETTAPTVALTAPSAGATVSGTATLTASASDNVYVAGVQFLLDGQPLGSAVTAAPYTLAWDTRKIANGSHVLAARAWDQAGNSTTSASRTVTVSNPPDTIPHTVQITNPTSQLASGPAGLNAGTDGADESAVSGPLVLSAAASDNIGVASVQFQLNGANIGAPDTTAPYRILWDPRTVADGTYSLTAVATDVSGTTATSSAVTVAVDHTAPTVTGITPAAGSTGVSTSSSVSATFSESIQSGTMLFTLRDPSGNTVVSTITYDDTTHTATLNHGTVALDALTTYTATVNATDLAGNAVQYSWSFTTANAIVGANIWDASTVPTQSSASDGAGIEVGVKFQSDVAGTITGLRFYKGAGNTGTHTGHLWTSTGQLLGTVTFSSESASGWQQANFATPVTIAANTTYVASYFAPVGQYAADNSYFSAGVNSGPLHALSSASAGGNGVYVYGGGFPTSSFNATNYWVDVVFSSATQGSTPPAVANETPVPNATGVSQSTTVTATFTKAVQAGTISFVLKDASGTVVPAAVSYNSGTNTATLTPSAQLAATTTYTATVSGATDLSGNVMTAPFSWSFTTQAASAAPTVISVTPVAGATGVDKSTTVEATFSKPVQPASVVFVVKDSAGNVIPGTVNYEDETNTSVFTPSAALAAITAYTATVSGATDLSGNVMTAPSSWSFLTAGSVSNVTLFTPTAAPSVASVNDANAVELGVKFRSDASGFITGLRFYKGGTGNGGTHVGHLWDASGNLLASATFSGETASGWQQVNFTTPVAIAANTTYVASYFAPNGHYSLTSNYFATGTDSGVLHAPSSASAGGNGVFLYGASGGFPNGSFNASNYFVDVVFSTSSTDTTPPTVIAQSPAPGANGVLTTAPVTATFSESLLASSVTSGTVTLKDASGNAVNATVSYDDATHTATLTPSAALAYSTTYTATVSGVKDLAGNALAAPVTWSFTTLAPVSNATLFGTTTPVVAAASDPGSVEVGVKFSSGVAGYITGLRFYKGGTNNGGAHVGHLWSGTGTLLATATFTNETASGWQEVDFATPVAVSANTTYVASYLAPQGHYAADSGSFNNAVTSGVLTALSSAGAGGNGVYLYTATGGFPTNSFNATNYFVDVVFSSNPPADTTPPTVTVQSPVPGEINVATGAAMKATFSESVQAATVTAGGFTLKDASGNAVAAAVAYDDATHTATLTPSAALAAGATYTATVSGVKDLAGNALAAPVTWSFTTLASTATLFAPSATPAVASSGDTSSVELGVKFTSDVSGYVTSLRFYKGTGNGGTHVGHLWDASGNLLASATFSGETASGWQQVDFSSPVAINANTTYVASYFAPQGNYSYTGNYFASGLNSGVLHAPSSGGAGGNGLYLYTATGAFPTNSFNATNYFVDVVFSTTAPSAGAASVAGQALTTQAVGTASIAAAPAATATTTTAAPTTTAKTVSTWSHSSAADFNAGSRSGTAVTNAAGGEIQLAPSFVDDFNGSGLGSAWKSAARSGSTLGLRVTGGAVSLTGGTVSTTAAANGKPVEGRVQFGAAANQYFGLATDLASVAGNSWAVFSTLGTTNTLYARVNAAGTTQDVKLGALPGGFHVYMVKPVAGAYQFYIDGALVATINRTITNASAMKVVLSAFSGSPKPAIQADWVRLDSYAASGTFTSGVLDAGKAATWGVAKWTATLPAGTGIVVETRSGSSATPDGTWSGWTAVSNGGTVASPGKRYLQYRVRFTTSDATVTAVLSDISFLWS